MADQQSPNLKRVGAAATGLFLFWSSVAVYAVHSSLPPNAMALPLEDKLRVNELLPQGWAFFTRDPEEEDVVAYVRDERGRWQSARTSPIASLATLWGISRSGRGLGIELGMLVSAPSRSAWIRCKIGEPSQACLDRASPALHIRSEYPRPRLCGDVGLVANRPVPWAWSVEGVPEVPRRAARVTVRC